MHRELSIQHRTYGNRHVAVLALIVLGPKRLPSAGRSLGQSIREFKDGIGGRSARELEETEGA